MELDINAVVGTLLTVVIGGLVQMWITIRKIRAEGEARIQRTKLDAEASRDQLYKELHKEVRDEVHERRNEVQKLTNEVAIMRRNVSTLENLNKLLQLQVEDKTREVGELRRQVATLTADLQRAKGG